MKNISVVNCICWYLNEEWYSICMNYEGIKSEVDYGTFGEGWEIKWLVGNNS